MSDAIEHIRSDFRVNLAAARSATIAGDVTLEDAVVRADQHFGWLRDFVESLRQDATSTLKTEVFATVSYAQYDAASGKLSGHIGLYETAKPELILNFEIQGERIKFQHASFRSTSHSTGTYAASEQNAIAAVLAIVFETHLVNV